MNGSSRPDSGLDDFDLCKARKEYDAYVQAAREHHARTGEWPPDPLLDEVAEMRRQIMAEHGTDWRKVLQWHVEQDREYAQQNPNARIVEKPIRPVGVSGV